MLQSLRSIGGVTFLCMYVQRVATEEKGMGEKYCTKEDVCM